MPCAGNPRTAAGDTTTESQTTADIRLRSQPAAEPRIYQIGRHRPTHLTLSLRSRLSIRSVEFA
jgi:hypothetical protein